MVLCKRWYKSNTKYVAKAVSFMWRKTENPNIKWISTKKVDGDEWVTYTKKFEACKEVKSALFRFETDCTCAIFVNGEFVISGTGRLPERVNCHEVTSKIKKGENEIKMVLGSQYYQERALEFKTRRGYWFNSAAFELCVEFNDGEKLVVESDSSWEADTGEEKLPAKETMRVTPIEYDMFWKNAALWVEPELNRKPIPAEVEKVVGKEYVDYATTPAPEFVYPIGVVETNMIEKDGGFIADADKSGDPYIIFDFGRLVVGYTDFDYKADADTRVLLFHDSSESVEDFAPDSPRRYNINKIGINQPLKAGEGNSLVLRRRAYRYLKMQFAEGVNISFNNLKVRPCMFPAAQHGWFNCSDEMLNDAWEVGKYTLQVNKQQEYESCPRNEMQFFSGDGRMDAWVDLYAFGDMELMNASLAVKHDETCTGVLFTDRFNKNVHQWDYYGWRIVCIYDYYKMTGDKEFVKRYFDEGRNIVEWYLERCDYNNLIFQKPCFTSSFTFQLGQNDWSCSDGRLGEKPYLNAILYASLVQMAEMARFIGKKKLAKRWEAKAKIVKNAINERLWSEEEQSYMDELDYYIAQDTNIIPILFGVADEKRAKAALKTMKEKLWSPYGSTILDRPYTQARGGNATISPMMCTYEAMMRFEYGEPDDALELIRRVWGTMLKKGARTFWEYSPNNDTDKWDIPSHAWAGGCTYLLSAYVLGIRPTAPNYKAMVFEPKPCDLENFKGVVPTAQGLIAASFDKKANKFVLAVPKKVEVEFKLPEGCEIEVINY